MLRVAALDVSRVCWAFDSRLRVAVAEGSVEEGLVKAFVTVKVIGVPLGTAANPLMVAVVVVVVQG